MIDMLIVKVQNKYKELCRRLKINNWQKEVFMSNSIDIMDNLEKRIKKLEDKIKKLEDKIKKLEDK